MRSGAIAATPRLQESIAVVGRADAWVLVNASPDVHAQIERTPALYPRAGRDSPIAAIVLTNGDLDHVLGLLSLREWHRLVVYATARVWSGFRDGNVLVRTLERFDGQVTFRPLALDVPTPILGGDGIDTGLVVTAVAVPGKLPVHLAGLRVSHAEDNVLVRIADAGGATLVYAPGVARVTDAVLRGLADAACVFFDGTFWSEDELVREGLADKTAADMAHVPVGGPRGSLAALGDVAAPRRFFIHLNNTQPLLRSDAPERAFIRERGWDVAEDGMEITL